MHVGRILPVLAGGIQSSGRSPNIKLEVNGKGIFIASMDANSNLSLQQLVDKKGCHPSCPGELFVNKSELRRQMELIPNIKCLT